MKIVQINTFPYKATGNIMLGIHRLLTEEGHDSYVVWGRGRDAENDHEIVIKDDLGIKLHGAYTRITDRTGFASKAATKKLLAKLDKIRPDIIHLHNIHGYYINVDLLFNYIRSKKIKVVWTLHDCWPITGHCAYFDMVGCEKWKTGCHDCEQKGSYPASKLLDSSAWNWDKKWQLFSGLGITIVTPCEWLKRIIEQSFLREYPIKVLYNGIDLDVFKPSYTLEIRRKYCPGGKAMVLGVASEWTERKGLNDFIRLAEKAPDIQFVVVGLTEEQVKQMPDSIMAIQRTSDVQELVELYSTADVFLNPTYEDNFPSTNIEALACGTPIIVYDTGGCPEAVEICNRIAKQTIGTVIKKKSSSQADIDLVAERLREMIKIVNSQDNSIGANVSGGGYLLPCVQFENSINTDLDTSIKAKNAAGKIPKEDNNFKVNTTHAFQSIRDACRTAAEAFNMHTRLHAYLDLYKELYP